MISGVSNAASMIDAVVKTGHRGFYLETVLNSSEELKEGAYEIAAALFLKEGVLLMRTTTPKSTCSATRRHQHPSRTSCCSSSTRCSTRLRSRYCRSETHRRYLFALFGSAMALRKRRMVTLMERISSLTGHCVVVG